MESLTNYLSLLHIEQIIVFIILLAMTIGSFSLRGWKKYILFAGGIIAIILYSHITIESAKVQQANEKRAQQNEERLKEANRQLEGTQKQLNATNNKLDDANKKLDDLTQTITKNVPGLEGLESYDSIMAALKNIESRTTTLEKETQQTVFILGDRSVKQLPDGRFDTRFNLIPIGKNIIPMFKVGCKTKNNAKIERIIINRNNTPLTGMSSTYSSLDKTFSDIMLLNSIEPGILNISVLTDKKPEMSCEWSPVLP